MCVGTLKYNLSRICFTDKYTCLLHYIILYICDGSDKRAKEITSTVGKYNKLI